MGGTAPVCSRNQSPIEPGLAPPRLVSATQDDAPPHRVERERESPDTACRIEAEFLHVGVARPVQRIDPRPAQVWTEYFEHGHMCEQFILHCFGDGLAFRHALRMELNVPRHGGLWLHTHMLSNTYLPLRHMHLLRCLS